ncbi:MAG: thiamine pyrophosphate-binding protein, partial [Pseudomonadota bacterium]
MSTSAATAPAGDSETGTATETATGHQSTSNTMRAAQLLVKCLEREGVEYIFGIPGEENIGVMDALLDSDIRFVVTRHEQGAAFMADVYGRLTG